MSSPPGANLAILSPRFPFPFAPPLLLYARMDSHASTAHSPSFSLPATWVTVCNETFACLHALQGCCRARIGA